MEPSIAGAARDPQFRRDVAWGLLDAVNRGVTANALGRTDAADNVVWTDDEVADALAGWRPQPSAGVFDHPGLLDLQGTRQYLGACGAGLLDGDVSKLASRAWVDADDARLGPGVARARALGLVPLPTAYPMGARVGVMGPSQGYLASLAGVTGSDQSLADKAAQMWGTTKYHFRNSDQAQGAAQALGGAAEVAGAAGIAPTGVGLAVSLPLALHGSDNIAAGIARASGRGDGSTLTYRGVKALTGSPVIADAVDQGIPFVGGVASLGSGLRAAEDRLLRDTVYRGLTPRDVQTLEDGAGLTAKAPNGTWTREQHILNAPGTPGGAQLNDPWIGTSRLYDVAKDGYDSGHGVVGINLRKIPRANWSEPSRDLLRLGPDGKVSKAYSRAMWSQEVPIYQNVPPDALVTPFAPLSGVDWWTPGLRALVVGGSDLLEGGR